MPWKLRPAFSGSGAGSSSPPVWKRKEVMSSGSRGGADAVEKKERNSRKTDGDGSSSSSGGENSSKSIWVHHADLREAKFKEAYSYLLYDYIKHIQDTYAQKDYSLPLEGHILVSPLRVH